MCQILFLAVFVERHIEDVIMMTHNFEVWFWYLWMAIFNIESKRLTDILILWPKIKFPKIYDFSMKFSYGLCILNIDVGYQNPERVTKMMILWPNCHKIANIMLPKSDSYLFNFLGFLSGFCFLGFSTDSSPSPSGTSSGSSSGSSTTSDSSEPPTAKSFIICLDRTSSSISAFEFSKSWWSRTN